MEDEIRARIQEKQHSFHIEVDRYTPTGKLRSQPMYSAFIRNDAIGKERVVKGKSDGEVDRKCEDQITKWDEQETKMMVREAKADAVALAEEIWDELNEEATSYMAAMATLLKHTLTFDDRIDWNELRDRETFPRFSFREPEPKSPIHPSPPDLIPKLFWEWLFRSKKEWREAENERKLQDHVRFCKEQDEIFDQRHLKWTLERNVAKTNHEKQRKRFSQKQAETNHRIESFCERFEAGDSTAVCEYLGQVFERSEYPESLFLEHAVAFDPHSQTVVVSLSLPSPDDISDVTEYRFIKTRKESKPVHLKPKQHADLYESVLHQIALRTIHEVFEAVYTSHVQACVVNAWVTSLNKATGNDDTSCIFSVRADRESFEAINLSRVEPSECFKTLKGLVAGPLSQLAPVKPILELNREDHRFIESQEVLAETNSQSNLAEMPWQDFEHLVRELFAKEFGQEGAEVKVTQSSRDGGVDAIAFDPDPIRGGKFVIQAKRFTKNVPVSAVRDLYGTMIHEGATKGILVTTSHYGRESRKFSGDKPITLIDGNQLVYMLEQHGHKVRIDVDEARAKRLAEKAAVDQTQQF